MEAEELQQTLPDEWGCILVKPREHSSSVNALGRSWPYGHCQPHAMQFRAPGQAGFLLLQPRAGYVEVSAPSAAQTRAKCWHGNHQKLTDGKMLPFPSALPFG